MLDLMSDEAMGQIVHGGYQGLLGPGALLEFDAEVEEIEVCSRLLDISSNMDFGSGNVCYLVGMGGVQRKIYKKIENIDGAEVVWFDSFLPGFFKIFCPFVASFGGVVKVNNKRCIVDIFPLISDQSMAGIYWFPASYEDDFLTKTKNDKGGCGLDFGVKSLKKYFFYIVDFDNYESKTGVYEIVSVGDDAKEWVDVFK